MGYVSECFPGPSPLEKVIYWLIGIAWHAAFIALGYFIGRHV